ESFARSDRERKVIILSRAFRVAGGPSVLPPGTPKDRVAVVQEAFRKTYKDPEFLREYKKLTGDEASPLLPEDHEKVIKEIPRARDHRALQENCRRGAVAGAVRKDSS